MILKTSPIYKYLLLLAVVPGVAGGLKMAERAVRANKDPNPEEIVERMILAYGSRAVVYGIQKNGIVRSLVKFITPQGETEGKSAVKFIRKEKMMEDLRLIEIEMPGTNYTIGFDGKEIWSSYNGETRKPGEQEVSAFTGGHKHSYEALLRYKENDGKLEYIGSKQLGTLDLDIIDLTLPDGTKTRYEISRRSYRVLYLDYEDSSDASSGPVKYRLYFKDFRVIQNSLIPYVTQVFRNGTLVEERKVVEVVFNVQMDEKVFKGENSAKPAEPVPGTPPTGN